MVHTRSDIIATLRSRNVRGSLTKMKKSRLLELLRETAPPSSPRDVQKQGIYLAPDPEQKQSGGHAYKVDGSLGAMMRCCAWCDDEDSDDEECTGTMYT